MTKRAVAGWLTAIVMVGCGGSTSVSQSASRDAAAGSAGASEAGFAGGGGTDGGGKGGASGAGDASGAGGAIDAGSPADGGGGASPCSLPPIAPGTTTVTITSSGQQRTARLVVPSSYTGKTYVPLVMMFAGFLEDDQAIEQVTAMTPIAQQRGFIVVYPQGLGDSFNAGACCGTSSATGVADVQFTEDLLDSLESRLCIDPKRVFAAGFSNGGMFSSRLGCEVATRFAAIAPVSGPIAISSCKPARPMPVIEFHGTSDIVVPYNGGGLAGAMSVPAAIDLWKTNAGCTDAAPTQVYQNGDTTCTSYVKCQEGAAVELCTINGGGHQWPGGTDPTAGVGYQTHDIDASSTLIDFFMAHPM
jgi:polyhydroxybutyrate depolymerase